MMRSGNNSNKRHQSKNESMRQCCPKRKKYVVPLFTTPWRLVLVANCRLWFEVLESVLNVMIAVVVSNLYLVDTDPISVMLFYCYVGKRNTDTETHPPQKNKIKCKQRLSYCERYVTDYNYIISKAF
jgi:hypothetical protein